MMTSCLRQASDGFTFAVSCDDDDVMFCRLRQASNGFTFAVSCDDDDDDVMFCCLRQASDGFTFAVSCDRGRILYTSESTRHILKYKQVRHWVRSYDEARTCPSHMSYCQACMCMAEVCDVKVSRNPVLK